MAAPSPRQVLAQLQSYAVNPPAEVLNDPELRSELHRAARKVELRLEETRSIAMRLSLSRAYESSVFRTASRLGLFQYLDKHGAVKTLPEISAALKTDPVLLLRVLRSLAAQGIVTEVDDDGYALSSNCGIFANPKFMKGVEDIDFLGSRIFDVIPEFLEENGFANPVDRKNGPFQKLENSPNKDFFEILMEKHAEKAPSFAYVLGAFAEHMVLPHQMYPVQERLFQGASSNPDEYLWVDVGGGMGSYTVALESAHPKHPGKCLVQEQDMMVKVAKAQGADQKVDFMTYDFFDEQPVKGARAYYFRNIFHNWPDKESKLILERVRAAMKPGYSRLLIQDLVIPERGATSWETTQDWLMMMGYCAHERTKAQWEELLRAVGLRITKVYTKPLSYPLIEVEIAN